MSGPVDHAAEAAAILAEIQAGMRPEVVSAAVAGAQVHATLALVEAVRARDEEPSVVAVLAWLDSVESPIEQANALAVLAERAQDRTLDPAAIAGRILHWEKLDPTVRAQRVSVQRFCRDLLAHLDEGSS